MDQKQAYIQELEHKKQTIHETLIKCYDNLTQIKTRLDEKLPENKRNYKLLKKQCLLFSRFYARTNHYERLYFNICSDLIIARLSHHSSQFDMLTAYELNEYVKFIEQCFTKTVVPIDINSVYKINRCALKMNRLLIKLLYIRHVKMHFSSTNETKRDYCQKQCDNIAEKIEIYKQLINDIKAKKLQQMHSSLIRKLTLKNFSEKHDKIDTQNNIIVLENVSKYYANNLFATRVLSDINLKIEKGEFVVILGPSGSGKTTLLNLISGMDRPTYGNVIVNNQYISTYNNEQLTTFRRQTLGYVFQQYGLLPNLTVRENVEIGQNLRQDTNAIFEIDDILRDVGIYELRNKLPSELSGGQQQRVSIARSIAKNPKIIFADEPTGAVDEEMTKQIMQLFTTINKKYKTTIIIVTHNSIFADLATKVIKIKNFKIAQLISNQKPKSVQEINW